MTIEEQLAAMAVELAEVKDELAEQKLRAARIEGEQRSQLAANTKLRSDFLTLETTFTLTMQNSDARIVEVAQDATEDARKAAAAEAESFGQRLLAVFREAWGMK